MPFLIAPTANAQLVIGSHCAPSVQRAIDARVNRLLLDLGNPEPPLDLATVRELLKIDRHFYTLSDPSLLQGFIHKVRIAGHNVVQEPRRLIDVVKKLSLKALMIPERKQILIDTALPELKHRWVEGHEITHAILDWHAPFCHGDRERTITESCHAVIEAEANYGSGRLLFLGNRFREEVLGGPVTLTRVKALAGLYHNTVTSTLWRAVEYAPMPALGMISVHPWTRASELVAPPIRHVFASPAFGLRFSRIAPSQIFAMLSQIVKRKKGGGPLGAGVVKLLDDNGAIHEFEAECFSNTHDVLSLLTYRASKVAAG